MSILWVRHAESGDNAGWPAMGLGLSELTETGRRQAADFAAGLTEAPDVLVHSPFVRSRQTAEAVLRRFPGVAVEVWPIQEITILGSQHFRNSSWQNRSGASEAYWDRCSPEEREGEGAETFAEFIQRSEDMMRRALRHPAGSLLLVSHGHFLRGMMWRTRHWGRRVDAAAMREFRASMSGMGVGHLSRWKLSWKKEGVEPLLTGLDGLPWDEVLLKNEA